MSGFQVRRYHRPFSTIQLIHLRQEAAVFAEIRVPAEVWELMPQLNESIELFWIMAGNVSNT
jgi:hypothetical protein